MSAMPAWGTSLEDPAIWELVALVERLPAMSPEDYQRLTR
jgi:mono/diheme cytochrome c family protein